MCGAPPLQIAQEGPELMAFLGEIPISWTIPNRHAKLAMFIRKYGGTLGNGTHKKIITLIYALYTYSLIMYFLGPNFRYIPF